MGPPKLADTLLIELDEAKRLINKFFTVFPAIKKTLTTMGNFGKKNGYIQTFMPYLRRRYFPNWSKAIQDKDFVELGSIERASMNTPIQGEVQLPWLNSVNCWKPEKVISSQAA